MNQLLAINPLTLLGPHGDLLVVLALLLAAILMFMRNQPRMDVVALMMIAALPFTDSGKIEKRKLRALLEARLAAGELD